MDMGIPLMFGEVLGPIFDQMAKKKGKSIRPPTSLIDYFSQIISPIINDPGVINELVG